MIGKYAKNKVNMSSISTILSVYGRLF